MTTRDPSSKSPAPAPTPGARHLFGRWLQSLRPDAALTGTETDRPTDGSATPQAAVEALASGAPRVPEASSLDEISALDEGAMPDSERTVYRRVPQDLLQRAKKAAVSEAPPPAPRAAFYDDGDDRTAVFVPPRELLLSGNSEPAPPLPRAAAEDGGDPALGRVTPVIDEQASLLLAQTRSKPAPAPEPEPAPQQAAPSELAAAAGSEELVLVPATRRRRTIALVAFFVFLFLAAGLAYMQHWGRILSIPS